MLAAFWPSASIASWRVSIALKAFGDSRRELYGSPNRREEGQTRRASGKDLVRVSEHALPAEVTDLVHDFGRTGSAVGQIAAVKHQIGSHIPKILQNRFKRRSVPVDVR